MHSGFYRTYAVDNFEKRLFIWLWNFVERYLYLLIEIYQRVFANDRYWPEAAVHFQFGNFRLVLRFQLVDAQD